MDPVYNVSKNMEFRSIIYNASRDGNLNRLQIFLENDNRSEAELKSLLDSTTFEATPLVIACRNGHSPIVKYLIDKGADIELTGTVTFDGQPVEGATPLWVAAAAGHREIVEYLVKAGADINRGTCTHSTPLRAACYDGLVTVVSYLLDHNADPELANKHGHTPLMIACYRNHIEVVRLLISHGVNVNRQSLKGNTALHDACEAGSLEIVKLLIESEARSIEDSFSLTPLKIAAVIGRHTVVMHFVSELERYIARYNQTALEQRACDAVSSLSLDQPFAESGLFATLGEIIDALELLGATSIDKRDQRQQAIVLWTRAFEFRGMTNCCGPSCTGIIREKTGEAVEAYGGYREARTLKELTELEYDVEGLRMQALLVRERILGREHPDTAYYIRYRGATYAEQGEFSRTFELWLHALNIQSSVLEPLCAMTLASIVLFVELFAFMIREAAASTHDVSSRYPTFDEMFTILRLAVHEVRRALVSETLTGCHHDVHIDPEHNGAFASSVPPEEHLHRLCLLCLHLAGLAIKLEHRMTSEDTLALRRLLYSLVQLHPRGCHGASLLHMACSCEPPPHISQRHPHSNVMLCSFPMLGLVRDLVCVGADPNATDRDGDSALHVLLKNNKVRRPSIIRILLDAGAHVDARNKRGERPIELLRRTVSVTSVSMADVCPMKYITLKCLAARVVKSHNLPYKCNDLPRHLHTFVDSH